MEGRGNIKVNVTTAVKYLDTMHQNVGVKSSNKGPIQLRRCTRRYGNSTSLLAHERTDGAAKFVVL